MKKLLSLFVCAVLAVSMAMSTYAAGASVTLNASAASVKVGGTVTVTAKISGCDNGTSVGVDVTHSDKFELVSGEMLRTNGIVRFDKDTKKGTFGYTTGAGDMNGDIVKIVLKALSVDASAQSVSINVQVKNGATVICNDTATKTIKIGCASHSYGDYSKVNNSEHERTCSVCSDVETKAHAWDSGDVIKEASCKQAGEKSFSCADCGAKKTESVAKTNKHSYGDWKITKEAECDSAGTQTRTCSVCDKTETKTIAALGHKFSKPTITKQPTCTDEGVETGKCSRCGEETSNTIKATGHKFGAWEDVTEATCLTGGEQKHTCTECDAEETRKTAAAGHDFEDPKVVKEATISSAGLMEGKCKNCGETTQQTIPCSANDEKTGISLEADEGVFAEGTTAAFAEISKSDTNYQSVKNSVADKGGRIAAYSISFAKGGAAVNANGEYTLSLPNKANVDSQNIVVCFVSEDGIVTEMEFAENDDGTLSVKTAESGTYVIVDKSADGEADSDADTNTDVSSDADKIGSKKGGKNVVAFISVLVGVLAVAGAIVFITLKKEGRI